MKREDSLIAEIASYCAELRSNVDLDPHAFCVALPKIFSAYSKLAYGRDIDLLNSKVLDKLSFEPMKGTLFCIMNVSWSYLHATPKRKPLDGVSEYLPGIKIKQTVPSTHFSKKLTVKVQIDLKKWNNLAETLLFHCVHAALVEEPIQVRVKQRMLGNIRLMLEHLYPTVSLRTFEIARELDVIDEYGVMFKPWFRSYLTSNHDSTCSLPQDIAG